MFSSEKEMSALFEEYLLDCNNAYFPEFKTSFGVPDFLIFFPKKKTILTISVELKLYNWKDGISQAFRYKNCSDISYAIIDEVFIHRALKNIVHFKKFNIGLASFNAKKNLKIHHSPKLTSPFCDKSHEHVINTASCIEFKDKPKLELIYN